jgi:hypothetical protein
VTQPDSVRTAWLDTAKYASRLEALAPLLVAAVELAGLSAVDDTILLPLTCDPSGLHRRKLWEAWRSVGERCGRWSALVALDARIRAAELGGLEPYREARPLLRREFPLGGRGNKGINRVEFIDPEDEDYVEPEPQQPRRRKPLVRTMWRTARARPALAGMLTGPVGAGIRAAGNGSALRGLYLPLWRGVEPQPGRILGSGLRPCKESCEVARAQQLRTNAALRTSKHREPIAGTCCGGAGYERRHAAPLDGGLDMAACRRSRTIRAPGTTAALSH